MGLRFNVSKCVALIIGKTIMSIVKNLVLYDDVTPWSKEMCYLGLYFKAGNKLSIDMSHRFGNFIGSIASVLKGRIAETEDNYVNVIKTKYLPILFYGTDDLKLESWDVRKFSVVWNTAFRWIFGINRCVHMRQYLKHCGTMLLAFLIDM